MTQPIPILPCDLDAERLLLASVLVDATPGAPILKACAEAGLQPKHFFEPKHQTIFQACTQVLADGLLPDEVTVTNALRSALSFDLAGGAVYLNELTTSLFTPSQNASACARIILEKHQTRQLVQLAREMTSKALSGAFKPTELSESFLAASKAILDQSGRQATTQKMELPDLLSFDRDNDPDNLIGRRWLCKGGSLMFSAAAGAGKSTLIVQMAACWALGQDLWGIKPVKPLRILILQSENDGGDCSEQWQDVTRAMWLSESQLMTLRENVFIYREAVKTGEAFGTLLEDLITRHNASLAIVDPLLGFAGGDVSKQDFCSHFLRHILQPVLMRTGCALLAVHHQNKPPRKKDEQMQSTYDFTGSSELANWFRATAILRREDQELPHFIFKLAKRGTRAGMKDGTGQFTDALRIRHSKIRGEIKWEINSAPPPEETI